MNFKEDRPRRRRINENKVSKRNLVIRYGVGRSETTLLKYCPTLTTYLPTHAVDIGEVLNFFAFYRGKSAYH